MTKTRTAVLQNCQDTLADIESRLYFLGEVALSIGEMDFSCEGSGSCGMKSIIHGIIRDVREVMDRMWDASDPAKDKEVQS